MSNLREVDQYRKTIFYAKTDIEPSDYYQTLRTTRDQDGVSFRAMLDSICKNHWSQLPEFVEVITDGGTFQLIFIIRIRQHAFVVRMNRIPALRVAWELYADHWAYKKLAYLNLPCPKSVVVDVSRQYCSTDYHITTYVDGMPLTHFQDAATQAMNPLLLHDVGRYVGRLHSVQLNGFGPLAIERLVDSGEPTGIHATWADYIFVRLDEHLEFCTQHGALSPEEAAQIRSLFDQHRADFICTKPVWLHGDLGNHNMLSHDGVSLNAIIDWEDSMSGDPVFDIAFWGTFLRDHMLHDFLYGYEQVSVLPHDFHVRYWLYYLRIALSKTVHRARFGYVDHPDREPASRRIQKALQNLMLLA